MTIERKGLHVVPKKEKAEGENPFGGEFEAKCRICQIVRDHPDLARLIHEMHFRDRASYRDIAAEANSVIEKTEIDVKPILIHSFVPHFQKHVPGDQAYIYEMQTKALPIRNRKPQHSELMGQVVKARQESLSTIRDDFNKWQQIFNTITASMGIDRVDEDGKPVPGPKRVNTDAVIALKNATQAMATLASTMDRYVKDRSFVLDVLDKGIDAYGIPLMARLATGMLRLMKDAKTRDQTDPENFAWFRDEVRVLFEDSIMGLVDVARKETMEKFSL